MSLSEQVLSRLLDNHENVPPFRVLYEFDALCTQLGMEDAKTVDALYNIIRVVTETLPAPYKITERELREEVNAGLVGSAMTIPLYEVVDVPRVIVEILWQYHHELGDEHYPLKKKLLQNENSYHGLTPYMRHKKFVPPPTDVDEAPEDLIKIYLSGTPLFDFLLHTQVPFRIVKEKWSEHAILIARPGFGKSQLIGSFLSDALQDPDRAIIVLDPHGDLARTLIPRVSPERLVVIDTDNPPALNVFDFTASSEEDAFNVFKFFLASLAGGLSPKQETSILPLFELIKTIGGATLLTLHDIITERPKKGTPLKFAKEIASLDHVHRDFFENLFYTGNYQETRDSLQWKLIAALGRPTFRKMFAAPRNSIDLGHFAEARKVVVVRANEKALGKDGLRIFFLFLVSQYYAAGMRREAIPERNRHLVQMFIDEASTVLSSSLISDILVGLRKFQYSLTCATQVWDQIAQDVRPAVLGATSIKCVGEVQYNDRVVLSRDMNTTPDFLQACKAVRGSHAQWAFYVTEQTDKAVRVRVPYGSLERLPKTHEGSVMLAEPPRVAVRLPAEADTTTIADDDIPTHASSAKKQ